MTYAWLYCQKHDHRGRFTAGIFPLRALNSDFMKASWGDNHTLDKSHIEQFGQLLKNLLSEIFNPSIPFSPTPGKGCRYCPIFGSCRNLFLPSGYK